MELVIWAILEFICAALTGLVLPPVQLPAPRAKALEASPLVVHPERATCPYCKTRVGTRATSCRRCATPHHPECFAEFGRCSVFACNGRAA